MVKSRHLWWKVMTRVGRWNLLQGSGDKHICRPCLTPSNLPRFQITERCATWWWSNEQRMEELKLTSDEITLRNLPLHRIFEQNPFRLNEIKWHIGTPWKTPANDPSLLSAHQGFVGRDNHILKWHGFLSNITLTWVGMKQNLNDLQALP